jgi:uncharacterized protein YcfL
MKKVIKILIILLLVGCGTRKVNKTNTETTLKSELSVVDSVKIVTNINSVIDTSVDNFEITPVDTLKMLVIIDSQTHPKSFLLEKHYYFADIISLRRQIDTINPQVILQVIPKLFPRFQKLFPRSSQLFS